MRYRASDGCVAQEPRRFRTVAGGKWGDPPLPPGNRTQASNRAALIEHTINTRLLAGSFYSPVVRGGKKVVLLCSRSVEICPRPRLHVPVRRLGAASPVPVRRALHHPKCTSKRRPPPHSPQKRRNTPNKWICFGGRRLPQRPHRRLARCGTGTLAFHPAWTQNVSGERTNRGTHYSVYLNAKYDPAYKVLLLVRGGRLAGREFVRTPWLSFREQDPTHVTLEGLVSLVFSGVGSLSQPCEHPWQPEAAA